MIPTIYTVNSTLKYADNNKLNIVFVIALYNIRYKD